MKNDGWRVLDEDAGVLWREYAFSRSASATTFVFRGADGLVVVSPGPGLEPRDYDELAEHGEVRALVANNDFHNLGQLPWRQRFPEAASYCPAGAVKSLEKKLPGVVFRPLGDLSLPETARCHDAPGFKKGETIIDVETKKGSVWFTGDLLTNIQKVPMPPLRWLFTWTDSGPGFRLFKPAVWLFVSDKKGLREWALDRLAKAPPVAVVPAHGPVFEADEVAALARREIEKL